ncbi:MAG: hypothetical protein ACOY3L_13460 [Pseudomonadota bacterium]
MTNTSFYPAVAIETAHHAGFARRPVPASSTSNPRRMLGRLFLLSAASATASLGTLIGLLFYGGILSF